MPPHWQRLPSAGGGRLRPQLTAADSALLAWVGRTLAGGLASKPKLVNSVTGLLQKAIALLPPKERTEFFKSIRLFKQRGQTRPAPVVSAARKPATGRKPASVKKSASAKKPAKKSLRRK